jgi:hypothetical protein
MSLLFFGLFVLSVFLAALLEPVVTVARWNDVRIGLPHLYSALLLSFSSAAAYLTLTAPLSFLCFFSWGLVSVAVVCRRYLFAVDDAHWLRYAIQDQSQSLLVSLHTMNTTKTDKVRALCHKMATGAEDTLTLLHHLEKTKKATNAKKTKETTE